MNTFDDLYSKIMSKYEDSGNSKPVVDNDKDLPSYDLDDDEETVKIVSQDVECIEDEDSELYDIKATIEDDDDFQNCDADLDYNNGECCEETEDRDDLLASLNLSDFEDELDMLTEADDDPFAAAPAEEGDAAPEADASAEGGDAAPAADAPAEGGDAEAPGEGADEAEKDEPVDPATKDAASYQVKLDLIVTNITSAFKTTVNSAGSELYDKIIIYGFEESIKVFVEDYLKKMMDGDIKINTIERMDIITFAAPNIAQIVKKLIENLAKK